MIPVDQTNALETAQKVRAGELPGPAKSLAEAVCRVMEQVGYVQKDKQMQGGGSYRYVSVEAVIDALRPEMIKQQLVLLPVGVQPMTNETFENAKGTRQNRTQVIYTFNLLHAPSGETYPVVVIGEAIDVGDKSSNKAMTAARKYALIMAFNIETGLDPDDTPSADQERRGAKAPEAAPVPAKPHLVAKYAMKFGQCADRPAYLAVCEQVAADAECKALNDADRATLKSLAKMVTDRLPPPEKKAEKPQPAKV